MSSEAEVPSSTSVENPPSYPTRLPSKFLTGPGTVITSGVQMPPPAQLALVTQGPPGFVPPVQTPGTGEPGCGNFWKSGIAGGIGEVRVSLPLTAAMKPVKPDSPPPSKGVPPFGSLNGP